MDDSTLAALEAALATSPSNAELRSILIKGLLERQQADKAWSLSRDVADFPATDEHKRLSASAALAAGGDEAVLELLDEDNSAESLMLKSRALARLERNTEGLEAYKRAVTANPALEDVELRDRLSTVIRSFPGRSFPGHATNGGDSRPQLKVYSNDDTTDDELSRLLVPNALDVDFSDVGGLDAIKRQIHKKIILPFQKPSLFARFKKRVGGGILLYGPPGCGKTLLARATAGECKASFFNVAISDVLDMYIGESEAKLHALFEKARADAPSVLFFDEVEALGGKRQYTRESTSAKLVSQFLSEMDGFTQNNSGVLILGATNVPWAVDPAFRRPGRFDRLLFVPPPDRMARQAILEILLKDRPVADGLKLTQIASKTSGFSGADLQNLVETAADEAIEASIEAGDEVPIAQTHLMTSLRDVRSTTLEWLTTARNYARYANEGGQYDEVLSVLDRYGKK